MRRNHQKQSPSGAFGRKKDMRPLNNYAVTSAMIIPDIVPEESIGSPSIRMGELTHDTRDIHDMVAWFPASGFMTTLVRELAIHFLNEGGNTALEEFGISEINDLDMLHDMQAESVLEILETLLASIPDEHLAKKFGQDVVHAKQLALVRSRNRNNSSESIDYETGFVFGCTGKKVFVTEVDAKRHLETHPGPARFVYRCANCKSWHITKSDLWIKKNRYPESVKAA